MSGLALLDKAGWLRLGPGDNQTPPQLIALTGIFMLFLIPLVLALLQGSLGMPCSVSEPSSRFKTFCQQIGL